MLKYSNRLETNFNNFGRLNVSPLVSFLSQLGPVMLDRRRQVNVGVVSAFVFRVIPPEFPSVLESKSKVLCFHRAIPARQCDLGDHRFLGGDSIA